MITIGTHTANMTDKEIREWIDYISKENPDVTEGTLDIVKTEDENGETVELTLRGILSAHSTASTMPSAKEVEDRIKHKTGEDNDEI